jgi:sulfate transport system ATP-binding protein
VFAFIGESSELPVTVCHGKVWLDDRPLSIPVDGVADGPARLFLRPHDVAVVDESAGAIAGVVTTTHRNGGLRRFDLAIGDAPHRVEIALPAADSRNVSGRIAFLPRRWRLYPAGERYSKT